MASPPKRLTIDVTVVRDYLDPTRPGNVLAKALFELARRGEVELATAPQGYRLDVDGDLAEQLRETFDREKVGQARQVARVSEVTYPGEDLIVGNYVEGFVEAWGQIATNWPNAPGPGDRFHVETHIVERRDVFLTADRRLLRMCRLLSDEHGFPVIAMTVAEYLERQGDAPPAAPGGATTQRAI
jgi:hypothetical protein